MRATAQSNDVAPRQALPAAGRTPALTPERRRQYQDWHDHYALVVQVLDTVLLTNELPTNDPSSRERDALGQARQLLAGMNRVLAGQPLFDTGVEYTDNTDNTDGIGDAYDALYLPTAQIDLHREIGALVLAHPAAVLSGMAAFDHRKQVATDLVKQFKAPFVTPHAKDTLTDAATAALNQVLAELLHELALADAEVQLQRELLGGLAPAAQGFGAAELGDGQHVRRRLAQAVGTRLAHALHVDPRPPSVQQSTELNAVLGQLLSAQPQGQHGLSVLPRIDAPGHYTTAELLQMFDGALAHVDRDHVLNVVRDAALEAVKASPDFRLEGAAGREHVVLIDAAARADISPAERVLRVGVRAVQERALGRLKLSLLEEGLPQLQGRNPPGLPALLRPLTTAKSHLLDTTLDRLMDSPSREAMERVLLQAQDEHERLLASACLPAQAGRTGAILAGLLATVRGAPD